ncbi:hypothetical protein MKW92_018708 [Papaver armeniacum]|nr:hypothetical protein MKW92_018708 [Papaver armeniacum]
MLEQCHIRERERKNALTEEERQRDRERRRIAYHKRRQQTVKAEINDTNRQASTTAHAPSATSTSQTAFIPRRSPRISGQVERQEVDIEKEIYCHQGMTGASFSNNPKGKEVALVSPLSPASGW